MPKKAPAEDPAEPANVVPLREGESEPHTIPAEGEGAEPETTNDDIPAEAPKPDWPDSTEKRHLRCDLKPQELTAYGKEQAELVAQIDQLEEQKKASASEYKARIEEKSARSRRISGYIISGWQEKEIECRWIYECFGYDAATGERIYHPEKKTLVRSDTGEVIEVRDITSDERQMALPIAE